MRKFFNWFRMYQVEQAPVDLKEFEVMFAAEEEEEWESGIAH